MTPPCISHDRRTEGRRAGRTLLRLPRLLGLSLCSGCVSAPGSCSCSGPGNSSRPARTYSPRCQRKAWVGRGDRAAGSGDPGAPAAPLGGAAPALLLSSFSPPFPPPFPPPRPPPSPPLPFSSPSVSSPPRESGSCTVHGGLGVRVLVPSGGYIPGRRCRGRGGSGLGPSSQPASPSA